MYYSDYLQLDKVLNAQEPESFKQPNSPAHDEMLFIIIHQTYELWFKQILHEVGSVLGILSKPIIQDNSPDLFVLNHRLQRTNVILRVLVEQISIMETMTALDFLDFRDLLRPASGFQSVQFKQLEALLGLRMENRHGQEYYKSQLRESDLKKVEETEKLQTLIEELNDWLERMPFFDEQENWDKKIAQSIHPFWEDYAALYKSTLNENELFNFENFKEKMFSETKKPEWALSSKAKRAALFIFLYRDYPLLQLPFTILNSLLEMDELMATWRYRHMNMVHRIIGKRTGTGGSTGKDYLKGALDKHYVFGEIAELTTFLVNRNKLPALSNQLKQELGFSA